VVHSLAQVLEQEQEQEPSMTLAQARSMSKNLDPRLRRHLLQVREDGVNSFLLSLSCLSRCALTDECDP
jgi:hypothetical protein